jgi:Holliday junction resolvase
VALTGSNYERELKGLLQGERESVDRYARALAPEERPGLIEASQRPFLVVRAAGSLGFDLVALRSDLAFPLEVKASAADTIRFSAASGRADRQLEEHRRTVDRVGLRVVYAYRRLGHRSGDSWRLYATGSASASGRFALLMRRLPPVETTRDGNAVLRWESGMPLSRFLQIVHTLTAPVAAVA